AYFLWKANRNLIPLRVICDAFPFGFLGLWIIYHLLIQQYGLGTVMPWGISIQDPDFQYHPINWYEVVAGLVILAWLLRSKLPTGQGKVFRYFLILFGTSQMLISFFIPESTFLFGLSLQQLGYIIIIVVGFVMSTKTDNSKNPFVEN